MRISKKARSGYKGAVSHAKKSGLYHVGTGEGKTQYET